MKKSLIIIVTTICFFSCNLGRIYEVNSEYVNELKQYPSFLVSHFPSKIETLPISNAVTNDTTNNCIYYMLTENINDKTCQVIDSLNKKKVTKYNANDLNLVTIKTEGLLEWHPEKIVYYKSLSKGNRFYYPIPYFESTSVDDFFSSTTTSGLTNNTIIYIIDSKPGKYWAGLKPHKDMPVGWKNGYSKGLCLNSKKGIVIYWFIVW